MDKTPCTISLIKMKLSSNSNTSNSHPPTAILSKSAELFLQVEWNKTICMCRDPFTPKKFLNLTAWKFWLNRLGPINSNRLTQRWIPQAEAKWLPGHFISRLNNFWSAYYSACKVNIINVTSIVIFILF